MTEVEVQVKVLLERLSDAIGSLLQADQRPPKSVQFDLCREPTRRLSRLVEPEYGALAEQMYFERRKRDEIFQFPGLFGEPAWDMLLDLMVAKESGKKLSVTAVTLGAGAAATTALRYLTVLEKVGLVERFPDERDARRSWIRLSESGFDLMSLFFDQTSGVSNVTKTVRSASVHNARLCDS